MKDLQQYAESIGPAVLRELQRAELLADSGFYTEATLRVGRAIEASLYAIARERGLDLSNRVITPINGIRSALRSAEVKILRQKTTGDVRGLAIASKMLSETISHLTESTELRDGALEEQPRPNEQLLRELIAIVQNESVKRRLIENLPLMRPIQDTRNHAAHAALDGTEREQNEQDYNDFLVKVKPLMEALFHLIANSIAAKTFSVEEVD